MFKVGDRVRMVQTDDMVGTVVSDVKPGAGADGTDRQSVQWDRSGFTSDWNPGFLRPINTPSVADPDEVIVGKCRRRRGKIISNGSMVIVIQDGFSKVE